MMTIAGVLGFLIGIVTVMQIQWTSPLTHNISGTAKACVQTLLAYAIWRNDSTVKGNIGVALVILGSAIYAFVRMREMDAQQAAKSASGASATTAYMPVQQQKSVESAAGGDESALSSPNPGAAMDKEIEMTGPQKV